MTGKSIFKVIQRQNQEEINSLFEEIYYEYFRLLYFVSFTYLKNEQQVEDVVQNVFVIFFEKCFEKDFVIQIKDVKAYLCSCVKHDSIREKKKIELKDESINVETSLSTADQNISEPYLHSLIESLNDDEIEIIQNHIIFDKSFRQISEETKSSINTVKSKYRRAILKIRKEIKYE